MSLSENFIFSIYNFHIIFVNQLSPKQFLNIYLCNRELNQIINNNGGFVQKLIWDGRQNFADIFKILDIHKSIQIFDYLERGWNNCNLGYFEWIPYTPKILVLRELVTTTLTNRKCPNLEYLFLSDNNKQEVTIDHSNFPNLKVIGTYKATIKLINKCNNVFLIDFNDPGSIDHMIKKPYNNLPGIVQHLTKIYPLCKTI